LGGPNQVMILVVVAASIVRLIVRADIFIKTIQEQHYPSGTTMALSLVLRENHNVLLADTIFGGNILSDPVV